MVCWSCERATGDGLTCVSCGAIQPADPKADHFAVLDVPRRYDLDLGDLERRYRELSRKLHPDRFARADPRARRASLQRSVQLNEAWRTLKDPIKRAEYLLSLSGVAIGAEVPPALLMETLELREELGQARAAGDDAKVQSMARAMRARLDDAMRVVAAGFAPGGAGGALDHVAQQLVAIRYYRRFMDEVTLHDEAIADGGDGARESRGG